MFARRGEMSEGGVNRTVAPLDVERLEQEMESYQANLDEKCEEIYQLASQARSKGYDLKDEVEIPRAIDLADRVEKLLEEYLKPSPNEKPIPIQNDIRKMSQYMFSYRYSTSIDANRFKTLRLFATIVIA